MKLGGNMGDGRVVHLERIKDGSRFMTLGQLLPLSDFFLQIKS